MSNTKLSAWQRKSGAKKPNANSKKHIFSMIAALNRNLKHNNLILNEMKDSMRCFRDLSKNHIMTPNCRVVPFESNLTSPRLTDADSLYNSCSEQRTISIRICFTRIGEVNTIKETFEAEAVVETKWIDLNVKEQVIF